MVDLFPRALVEEKFGLETLGDFLLLGCLNRLLLGGPGAQELLGPVVTALLQGTGLIFGESIPPAPSDQQTPPHQRQMNEQKLKTCSRIRTCALTRGGYPPPVSWFTFVHKFQTNFLKHCYACSGTLVDILKSGLLCLIRTLVLQLIRTLIFSLVSTFWGFHCSIPNNYLGIILIPHDQNDNILHQNLPLKLTLIM